PEGWFLAKKPVWRASRGQCPFRRGSMEAIGVRARAGERLLRHLVARAAAFASPEPAGVLVRGLPRPHPLRELVALRRPAAEGPGRQDGRGARAFVLTGLSSPGGVSAAPPGPAGSRRVGR